MSRGTPGEGIALIRSMPTQGETLVAARTKFVSWASRTAKAELVEMAKGCICVQNAGGVLIDTARIQAPGLCDTHGEVRGKVNESPARSRWFSLLIVNSS
jgi:hypothetical protein